MYLMKSTTEEDDAEYLVVFADSRLDGRLGVNTFTHFYATVDDCVDATYCERLHRNQRILLRTSATVAEFDCSGPNRHRHQATLSISPLCVTFVRSADAERKLIDSERNRPKKTATADMRTRAASKRDRDGNPVNPCTSDELGPAYADSPIPSPSFDTKGCARWRSGCFSTSFPRARTSRNVAHYLAARATNGRDAQLSAMIALCTTARFHFPLANTVDSTAAARRSIRLRHKATDTDAELENEEIDNQVPLRRRSASETDSENWDHDDTRVCPRVPMRSVLDSHLVRLPRGAARSLAHEEASATESDEQDLGTDSSSDLSTSESDIAHLLGDRLVTIPSESDEDPADDDEDDLVTQRRIIDELARRSPPPRRAVPPPRRSLGETSTSTLDPQSWTLQSASNTATDNETSNAATFSDGPAQHTRSRERSRHVEPSSTSYHSEDIALRMRIAMQRMHRTANALRAAAPLDADADSDSESVSNRATSTAGAIGSRDNLHARASMPERLRMRAARVLVRDPFRFSGAPRRTFAAALNGRLVYSERSLPASLNGRLAEYIDRASLFHAKRPATASDNEEDDQSHSLIRYRSRKRSAAPVPPPAPSVCSTQWYDCASSLRVYESLVDTQARRLGALWHEKEFDLGAVNKLFASAWLNDKQVMVATKCNRAFVLDANGRGRKAGPAAMVEITLLRGSGASSPPRNPCGVHALELNPSGTLLATGGENPNDISVFNLPSLVPHAIFEGGHDDWIFDMKWIDDEYLVSGGRDSNLVLWKASAVEPSTRYARSTLLTGTGRRSVLGAAYPNSCDTESDTVPAHYAFLQPLCKRRCEHADKIRAICYNEARLELVVVSLDGSLHVFDAPSFRQRVTKSLVERHENVCITPSNDRSLYAIGSASHVTLIDARTLRHVVAVQSRYAQQGIRSVSFQNSLLTIGTGAGVVLFYDLRARKYLTLADDYAPKRAGANNNLELHCGTGYLAQDQDLNYMYLHYATNAVYTHAYDPSGTRLFTAGGPLAAGLWGNYAALWH